MKILLIALLSILTLPNNNWLVNSVWSHKIADGCINTLTFKPNGAVLEYDTLVIKGKDDSHSEDNGKITLYWITKYLIKNNALYVISNKKLVDNKWKDQNIKPDKNADYKRVM
jgi:hypothetical protein